MEVGGEAGEEVGAKSRGIFGRGKCAVEVAAELVRIGGEARRAGGVEECATELG